MVRNQRFFLGIVCMVLHSQFGMAHIIPFDARDIERAGEGCVAGYLSSGGNTIYFRGDTELLNRKLGELHVQNSASTLIKLSIHQGIHRIQNENESPMNLLESKKLTIPVDWCISVYSIRNVKVLKTKGFNWRNQGVQIPMRLEPNTMIFIDVWCGDSIDVKRLQIPQGFEVAYDSDATPPSQ